MRNLSKKQREFILCILTLAFIFYLAALFVEYKDCYKKGGVLVKGFIWYECVN